MSYNQHRFNDLKWLQKMKKARETFSLALVTDPHQKASSLRPRILCLMGIEAGKSLGSMALKVYGERVLNLYFISIISCQTHIITVIKSSILPLLVNESLRTSFPPSATLK